MKNLVYAVGGVVVGVGLAALVSSGDATPDMEIQTAVLEDNAAMEMSGATMTHMHPAREVGDGQPVPTVTHLVFPDMMDGYNVQILTQNFRFTPASINRDVVENEGHAHLYVNGKKIARLYSNWVHVPSSLLAPGRNTVSVTLNANDHSDWAVEGVPIASSVPVIRPAE